jgi:predicted nucleic acid-binding Zn ribbon protein
LAKLAPALITSASIAELTIKLDAGKVAEISNGSNGADRGNESQADTISPVSEPLTANFDSSEWCANRPFCKSAVMPGKKYCSDRCSLDGHILRRAREMVDDIGIVELNAILQRTM